MSNSSMLNPITRRSLIKSVASAGLGLMLMDFIKIDHAMADNPNTESFMVSNTETRVMDKYVNLLMEYHEKIFSPGYVTETREYYGQVYSRTYIPNGYYLKSCKKTLESGPNAVYTLYFCVNEWVIY